MNNRLRSRIRGTIVGTAIGDALGMPAEGMSSQSIRKLYGNITSFLNPCSKSWAHKTHNLQKGCWTDDTQLTIVICESILRKKRIDFDDIANTHIKAMQENSHGWGGTTIAGFSKIKSGTPWWNSSRPEGAGNGTPMKISPIGILMGLDLVGSFEAVTAIINISRMTHGDSRAAVAGILQAKMVASGIKHGPLGLENFLWGLEEEARSIEKAIGDKHDKSISSQISMARDIFSHSNIEMEAACRMAAEIGTGCFVVESFPFICGVLRIFHKHPELCMTTIINLGGDTDTTGAMAGAVLGAAYGLNVFPRRWRSGLSGYKRLVSMADQFATLSIERSMKNFERPRIRFSRSDKGVS